MSHVQRHDPHEEHRLQQLMMVGFTLAVSAALVIFGIHLAAGPATQAAQRATSSNSQSTQANTSAAPAASAVVAQSTAQAAATAPAQSTSTATAAQAQSTATAVPTPTATPVPTASVVDGASPQAVAAIQQFVARNGAALALGDAVGNPFTDTASGVVGQYYTQAVIEYHPELAGTPYAVELARIGVATAAASGLLDTAPFAPLPAATQPDQNCWFVKATGHRLCGGFRAFWRDHGLDLGDAGTSYRESLALFGYPISEEFVDPQSGLDVQYFERSKLEYDPSKPQKERVRPNLSTDMIRTRWGNQVIVGIQQLTSGN